MAHNVCCNSYCVYNVTCIYHTTAPILGVNYVNVLACCFLGPLFTDWALGCIGSPVFQSSVEWARGGGGVSCFILLANRVMFLKSK